MKKRQKLLKDEQWELIAPLFPNPRRRKDNRGRPWASNRAWFEGILWVLQTGAAGRFCPTSIRLRRRAGDGCASGKRRTFGSMAGERCWAPRMEWQFHSGQKGGRQSVKASGARTRSGWYWETVKVFRWEFCWKVPKLDSTPAATIIK